MIRKATRLDPLRLGFADYILIGLSTMLAAYAMTYSVRSERDGFFFCAIIAIGTVCSYFVGRLPWPILRWGGVFYFIVSIVAFRHGFEAFIPENYFTEQLASAGWLLWMISLGSFFLWRDGTILFQAVPSLALFGLVGCYDVYRESTSLFFVYLLCIATLMARAHARIMMRLASKSGYTKVDRLNEGPWRWMAGPEWALASAAGIIVLSLFGAPVLQETAKALPLSGIVAAQTPRPNVTVPPLFATNPGTVSVGRGPLPLTHNPVLRATLPYNEYLRSNTYDIYVSSGWSLSIPNSVQSLYSMARNKMKNPQIEGFDVELIVPLPYLPVPTEAFDFRGTRGADRRWDGSLPLDPRIVNLPPVSGRNYVLPNAHPTRAAVDVAEVYPALLDISRVPDSVVNLARSVTKGAKTDYEKAQLIEQEIGRRCTYNLNAPAVPPDSDAVDYFLFKSKQGYCDLFASSMVTMARSAGIPARYVVGYLPEEKPSGGDYIVRESDAHAWAELLFDDAGWVVFDPTELAASVPGAERGETNEKPYYATPAFEFGVPAAVIAVTIGAMLLIRSRKQVYTLPVRKKTLGRMYARFERALATATGHPRRLSQTPDEYLALGRTTLGPMYESAKKLNDSFETQFYGPSSMTPEELAALSSQIDAFRRESGRALAGSSKGKSR